MAYRTTPKMKARKRAHRETLLKTAIAQFGKRGYHATTVPMIVKASGSSTGSFYFYFRSKEDVFGAALESIGARVAEALNHAIAAAGTETVARMRAAIESLVHFLAENPAEARIIIVESSGLSPRLARIRRSIIDSHRRSVQEALSTIPGLADVMDLEVAASCWLGAVLEAVCRWIESGEKDRLPAQALADEIARFNLQGIRQRGEPPPTA